MAWAVTRVCWALPSFRCYGAFVGWLLCRTGPLHGAVCGVRCAVYAVYAVYAMYAVYAVCGVCGRLVGACLPHAE